MVEHLDTIILALEFIAMFLFVTWVISKGE